MIQRSVLLTGVTGAIGAWIANRALQDGLTVHALARHTREECADARVRRSVSITGGDASSAQIDTVEGDLLDVPAKTPPIDLIIHCAACTAFHERAAIDSRATNVDGLRMMLAFAQRVRVPFVHISTAYVCGSRSGIALEAELSVGQRFNNVYEQTKTEGEALVHRWSAETSLPAIILRPGIVLGDWHRGRAVRFNTLYHLMRTLDSVGPGLQRQRLRLVGEETVSKNIIPVDHFADIAWRLIRHGAPGTYHVTHPQPIRMGELRDIFADIFSVDIEYVRDLEIRRDRATSVERLCHRAMAPYRSYMTENEPHFDQRQTDTALAAEMTRPPTLDLAYFKRLLAYGRLVNWSDNARKESVSTMPLDAVNEYFTTFLAPWQNRKLLPYLKRLTARFAIAIAAPGAPVWSLELREGVLMSVQQGASGADCCFALDEATFLAIAAAQLSPRQAFFASRIKISGNMETGLRVASVLARFFIEYPFSHTVKGPAQEREYAATTT